VYGHTQPTLIEKRQSALRHTLHCCAHTVSLTFTRNSIRNTLQQILYFLRKIIGGQNVSNHGRITSAFMV